MLILTDFEMETKDYDWQTDKNQLNWCDCFVAGGEAGGGEGGVKNKDIYCIYTKRNGSG